MNIPRSKALSRDITSHVCTGFILDAFHYARPTGQRSVELTKGKWNDIIRKKQNFQPDRSGPFTFPPKFLLLLCEVGLETRIFLKVSDGPDRPVREDHLWRWTTFSRKISTWTEASHLCFDQNFRKFWHFCIWKHPLFPICSFVCTPHKLHLQRKNL